MESPSSLRLVMDAHGRGQVFLDGAQVPRVRGLTIEVEAGDLNRVYIQTSAETIEVEGQFEVTTIGDTSRKWAVAPPLPRSTRQPFWPAWIRKLFREWGRD